ncbi:retroviral-like aspartic protease family protein [Calothrix sp. FACHB-156]|nr:retroviral-like aspartic protease family protein [Calothrix membranacea FACHB-236]MBD2214132.1 retroviral-like aspartic protease family protein [Nostoc linckia FACHB-104]MBD2340321.1 retroviral-like aspartic protease family protein [Calothrix sp. FACHB-156]
MEALALPLFLILMALTIHLPQRGPAKIDRSGYGGIMVNVTFNQNQTFPMILDTGADITIITQKMANTLKVKAMGAIPITVANNQVVVWPVSMVNSVEVGGAQVENVNVAIAPEIPIGLLGQSFLAKCDYTIQGDVLKCTRKWTPEG